MLSVTASVVHGGQETRLCILSPSLARRSYVLGSIHVFFYCRPLVAKTFRLVGSWPETQSINNIQRKNQSTSSTSTYCICTNLKQEKDVGAEHRHVAAIRPAVKRF